MCRGSRKRQKKKKKRERGTGKRLKKAVLKQCLQKKGKKRSKTKGHL